MLGYSRKCMRIFLFRSSPRILRGHPNPAMRGHQNAANEKLARQGHHRTPNS
jgi:hypothetical protein